MKNVNPLHIIALLITLLLFLFFKLHQSHELFEQSRADFIETKKVALQLVELQSLYKNHARIKASLQKILHQPSLKDAKLSVEFSATTLKIRAKKMQREVLKSLMGKILNAPCNIKKLTIKRLSKTTVRLDMEIAL